MLKAALQSRGIPMSSLLQRRFSSYGRNGRLQSAECDLLILTGGVSVDWLQPRRFGGECIRSHLPPSRPKTRQALALLRRKSTAGIWTPGNPRAVLMCFHLYVWPLLECWKGKILWACLRWNCRWQPRTAANPMAKFISSLANSRYKDSKLKAGSNTICSSFRRSQFDRGTAGPAPNRFRDVVKCYWLPQV